VWLNFRRKSVVGLSLDFQLLNLLGFASYAIYNCALYYNDAVRRQYQSLHHGQLPAVHANDVFFALHAAAATAITLLQCVLYDRGGHRPARASVAAVAAAVAAAAAWAAAVVLIPPVKPDACPNASCPPESLLTWLSWLYFLGYIKLGVSLVKYMPQLVLNHRRRSTEGWNVWNVLLDFEGGALSLAQQALDSAACEDWSFFFGNPVKFGLSVVSLLFDVAFVAQHYCFYPSNRRAAALEAMERDLEKASCESGEEGEDGAEAPPSAERDPDAERRPLLA
jgi:cystinosin